MQELREKYKKSRQQKEPIIPVFDKIQNEGLLLEIEKQ